MTTIIVARHGATEYNVGGGSPERIRGWSDVPLNAQGCAEAIELAEELLDIGLTSIVSSDLVRAHDTALAVSDRTGVGVELAAALRPWNLGELTGQPITKILKELRFYADNPSVAVPGGESADEFAARFLGYWHGLVSSVQPDAKALVVTHSRNLRLVLGWLDGDKYKYIAQPDDPIPPGQLLLLNNDSGDWRKETVVKKAMVSDDRWTRARDEAQQTAALRGTGHGFIDWFAKALVEDRQVLYVPGEPETDGDLQEVDSDIGPLLVVYVPESLVKATLAEKIAKRGDTKGTWISAGRGSKKTTAHLTKETHRAKPAPKVMTSLHQRKPSGFEAEKDPIQRQVESKTGVGAGQLARQQATDAEQRRNTAARQNQPAASWKAPFTTFKDIEQRAAGQPALRMNPKTGEPYAPPGPYDRWVTMHPWGTGGEGQPVLITQVPGHKGRFMTIREPGQGRQRFREISAVTPEDAAKEAVQKRKEHAQKKFEEFVTGRREKAEWESDKGQAKYSQLRRNLEQRLAIAGHVPYTACNNPACKELAREAGLPTVHLYTPEVAKAMLQRQVQSVTRQLPGGGSEEGTQPYGELSNDRIRREMFRRAEEVHNWLTRDLLRHERIHEAQSKQVLGSPIDVATMYEGEAEKELQLMAGAKNAVVNAERRVRKIRQDIAAAATPEEKKLNEMRLKEAEDGMTRLRDQVQMHAIAARQSVDFAREVPTPLANIKAEQLPKPDLEEMAQRSSSVEEFVARRDYYLSGVDAKVKEYSDLIPKLEKELNDIRSGKATGAPPGKTGVKQQVATDDDDIEPGESKGPAVVTTTAVPAMAAMKARQMESEVNRQLNVARVMVNTFSRAAQTLQSNAIDPASQRKIVNFALDQEQQDAAKVIATARIKEAQEKARAEGRNKRATMLKVPGGKVEAMSPLDPSFIAEARKLADEYVTTKGKYTRDERTAEKSRGIVLPQSPHFGDLTTEKVVAERMKDIRRTVQDQQSKELVHQAWQPEGAMDLLGLDRDDLEKKIIKRRHEEGMYSAFHTMSVGTSFEGLIDPAVVNVLGQEGTARAVAEYLRQNAPDKMPMVRERIQKWVDTESDKHVADVLEEAQVLLDEARELRSSMKKREGNPVHLAEVRAIQKQVETRVRQHVALLSHALGQENAVNSLLGALKHEPSENETLPITLGGVKDTNDITTRMAALGLQRGVKEGEGDYTTQKAGNNWLVRARAQSLAKSIHKTHERIFAPEVVQQVEEIKNGVKYVNGKPVFTDDPQYLPPLFSMRQVGRDYGNEANIAKGHLRAMDAKNVREKLEAAIATLGLHGLDHRQTREFLGRESTAADIKDKAVRAEYLKMLDRLVPGADGSAAKDRKARDNYRNFIRKLAPGGNDAAAQELDPAFASRFVRNSFIEAPHHVLAYKDLDKMDGSEKDLLKRFWSDNVSGAEYGGRSDDTEGKAAWRYFMKKVGGEHAALQITQELLRDEHIGRVIHHAAGSGTRIAIGQKAIANAQHLGELAYKGPLAGLTSRRSLGDRAEAQLRHIVSGDNFRPGIASQFKATQQPGKLKTGLVKMYDEFVRQQRAIRQFGVVKRMAVLTEPGSGKTVTALGGYTEARAQHIAEAKKRGEKPTPFRSLWVVPAKLLEDNNNQVERELSTFLAENALRWKTLSGGEERFPQRLAHMKDNGHDIVLTSPETLRDDLLRIISDFKTVGGATRHIEGRGKLLDEQTRSSLIAELDAAEPDARRATIKAALKNLGIDFQHVFVDEGHRLANRPGKRESQMSNVITHLADSVPHFMLATASPAENDFGEVLDLLRKVRPDIFAKRNRANPELRTPYEHVVRAYEQLSARSTSHELERPEEQPDIDVGLAQAMRREIAPAVFNVPAGSTGVRGEYAEEPVTLTKHQQQALDVANNFSATARMFWSNPAAATKAMRWLAPQRFEGIAAGDPQEREIAGRLLAHVETLRRNAIDRVLHEGTYETNAKIHRLVDMVKKDPRLRHTKTGKPGSGIVFVNRIQSAHDVAAELTKQGVTAYPVTSQENPSNIKKWEREYAESRGSEKPVVLVVTPTGSVGKNYQSGVWTTHFDLPHSSYALDQREGRVNRAGQDQSLLHNIRLYAQDETGNKHEHELARERVIQSKAPLAGLFDHERVSKDDTDLAHLLSLEESVRPPEAMSA